LLKLYVFMTLLLITIFYISCSISSHAESGQNIFSIHVSSDTTGAAVDTGTHQISESGVYELVASQPDVGYEFSYWKVVSGEKNITILNKDSVKAKVTNANGNAEVKAVFVKEQLLLKVVAMPLFASDSIVLSPKPDGSGKYEYGTNVIVKMVPKAGWEITGWNGSVSVGSDSVNIIIKNDISDTVLLSPINAPVNVICVMHDALQNGGGAIGSSWVDAFTDLNTALAVSEGKTVWVAKGTYTPADINTSFTLHANSSVIGGFAGVESTAASRDSIHNTTILSGKINSTDNTSAIVNVPTGADNVCLSTFTIKEAIGNTAAPYGGVYALSSKNFIIQRCILSNNSPCAIEAGNKSKILQCILIENSGANGSAVSIKADSVFVLNSVISGNTTLSMGAIVVANNMNGLFVNNTIVNNIANSSAGIYTASLGRTFISNCIVYGNTSTSTSGTQIYRTDTVYYSDIQDTASGTGIGVKRSGWSISGNKDTIPLFTNLANLSGTDGYFFTDDDGLILSSGSQCVNTGGDVINHNDWKPVVDIRGKSRLNNRIDMGAYER